MAAILVTFEVSHSPIYKLNALALENISDMPTALLVFQTPIGWLKSSVFENI